MTSSLPIVSVIVPTFNRQHLITRCVKSLLSQEISFTFEIIVVDDGSTDGTIEEVERLDSSIRVIRQENKGASAARRRGIQESRAEIVAFLDSDDVAEPFHLQALWDALQSNDATVLAFARIGDMDGRPFEVERLPITQAGIIQDPLLALFDVGCFTGSMNLMTYRMHALAASEGRQRFRAANDYDFAIRIAKFGPFAYADKITIRCDRRSDGISLRMGAYQAAFAVLALRDGYRDSKRSDAELRAALRQRLKMLWPSAFVQLLQIRELSLAREVASTGLRYAPWIPSMRYLHWAWNSHRSKNLGIAQN